MEMFIATMATIFLLLSIIKAFLWQPFSCVYIIYDPNMFIFILQFDWVFYDKHKIALAKKLGFFHEI